MLAMTKFKWEFVLRKCLNPRDLSLRSKWQSS